MLEYNRQIEEQISRQMEQMDVYNKGYEFSMLKQIEGQIVNMQIDIDRKIYRYETDIRQIKDRYKIDIRQI